MERSFLSEQKKINPKLFYDDRNFDEKSRVNVIIYLFELKKIKYIADSAFVEVNVFNRFKYIRSKHLF